MPLNLKVVGTTGFEPATSSVSSSLEYVLSITYRPLETAKQRPRTPRPKIQQVILQAMEFRRARPNRSYFLIPD